MAQPPNLPTPDDLERRLDDSSRQAEEELGKRPVYHDTRVTQYQKQADILIAQIKLASSEVQCHKVCAVLSDI